MAHPDAAILLRAAFFLAVLAAIITALVRHGNRSRSALDVVCDSRLGDLAGFDGDPDLYGLGIRLGIYLQWLTDLITFGYLEQDRQYVLITYHVFSISITVALFVKIFTSACTFSAEVFIVLVLFWGGYNIVQVPMTQAIMLHNQLQPRNERLAQSRIPHVSRKLRWSMQLLNFIMSPITVWFWARIAADEGANFASTPGGTAYFFFTRIHGHAVKPFSKFMAIASAFNFLRSIHQFVPQPACVHSSENDDDENADDVSSYLITIVWVPLTVVLLLPLMIWTYASVFLNLTFFFGVETFIGFLRMLQSKVNRETGVSGAWWMSTMERRAAALDDAEDEDHDAYWETTFPREMLKYQAATPFLIAVWCIVAIELTLSWNSVSHVYDVDSAGQIIPLVTSISGLLDTISRKEILQGKPKQEHTAERTHENRSEAVEQNSSDPLPSDPLPSDPLPSDPPLSDPPLSDPPLSDPPPSDPLPSDPLPNAPQ